MVDTTVTIRYPKGKEETLQLSGEVQNHVLTNCQKASKRFKDGTIVVFEHHLSRMPELDKGDYADLVGAVSTTGEPDFREEEEQEEEQEDEETDPPAPGSVFSTADEHAITRVLGQGRHQLKRRKNNQPGKWVITTPKTIRDNFKTQGFGPTPAAALANYEKKMGSLGGQSLARLLTNSERKKLEWYARMNTSAGPTSLRTDSAKKFHADVYRPHLGVRIGGPFPTMERAIQYMQDLGL